MKTARMVICVGFLAVIVSAGVGVVLSDDVQEAVPPALAMVAAGAGLFAVIRRPLPSPRPWGRKRVVLNLAVSGSLVALLLGFVLIPTIVNAEDEAMRASVILITVMVLAALAVLVVIARKEHGAAQSSGGSTDVTPKREGLT